MTIETSSEIVELNKKQLRLHQKKLNLAKFEFEQWKTYNGFSDEEE
jgi:hypothetical protein